MDILESFAEEALLSIMATIIAVAWIFAIASSINFTSMSLGVLLVATAISGTLSMYYLDFGLSWAVTSGLLLSIVSAVMPLNNPLILNKSAELVALQAMLSLGVFTSSTAFVEAVKKYYFE